jgi:hypothetical protein
MRWDQVPAASYITHARRTTCRRTKGCYKVKNKSFAMVCIINVCYLFS